MRWKNIWVAGLVGLLMVSGSGAAFASQESESADRPDLGAVKERVLDRIEDQIDRLVRTLDDLEGEEGIAAEQRFALAVEGIAIFEAAVIEVEAAATLGEVVDAVRDATAEYRAHRRVRLLYAHVQGDINKFTKRLDRLDGAIEQATEAGIEVSAAVEESMAAAVDLASAQEQRDAIDPSMTGAGVVDALKDVHGLAHSGQRHIRTGWSVLSEALPSE